MNSVRPIVALAACASFMPMTLSAQTQTQPPPQSQTSPAPQSPPPPPEIKLGLRVETLRQQLKVRPTLVIVPDTASYIRAIEKWSIQERFPVLIDDGSDLARENIARFVRDFAAKSIVRWQAPDDDRDDVWPDNDDGRCKSIERAVARAWERENKDELREYWKQLQFAPPGVIVADPNDRAWTAALALAAGHGQPLLFVTAPKGGPTEEIGAEPLAVFDTAITTGLEELEIPYTGRGDEIEAITICLNMPARVPPPAGKNGSMALTDHIGRAANGDRYAWGGMVFGDEATAAYRAMSALFIRPTTAWFFDGYAADFAPPFAASKGADLIKQADFRVELDAPPKGGLAAWRQRIRGGVDAGFINVNTSGHARWFDLTPGRATSADVPMLRRPALVHFIHSFSAQWVGDTATIAGRFLHNGAYAYVGSVDEPFLGAFCTPENFVGRMFALMPLGAAVRRESEPVWKINVIGDPLITMARPVARHDEPFTIPGAISVEDEMKTALKDGKFAKALSDLVLLGRDADAVRLIAATLKDRAGSIDAEFARAGVFPAFRALDAVMFIELYARLSPETRSQESMRDLLWQIGRPIVATGEGLDDAQREKLVGLLRTNIRDLLLAEDARVLAPVMKRLYGPMAVESMMGELMSRAKDDETRQKLSEALKGL